MKPNFPTILRTTNALLLLLIALWAPSIPARAQKTITGEPSITAAGNRIVGELEGKDFVAFDNIISSAGLLVVKREVDWKATSKPIKDNSPRPGYLSFQGQTALVWREYELAFPSPVLSDKNYESILTQFSGLIQASYAQFIAAAHETSDEFQERHLGPTVTGKIASNTHWYIYLTLEQGKWKVWKLEYWQH